MPVCHTVKIRFYRIAAKREIFSRIKATSAQQQVAKTSLLKEIAEKITDVKAQD